MNRKLIKYYVNLKFLLHFNLSLKMLFILVNHMVQFLILFIVILQLHFYHILAIFLLKMLWINMMFIYFVVFIIVVIMKFIIIKIIYFTIYFIKLINCFIFLINYQLNNLVPLIIKI